MTAKLDIHQPTPFENLSTQELHTKIDSVLAGRLPGFVVAASMTEAFSASTAYAQER